MTKLAYLLMVHKNPEQVTHLFKKIYNDEDIFFFQVFQTKDTPQINVWKDALLKKEKKNIFLFFNYKASYANFRQVKATLEAMTFFQNQPYNYFINLSGQCYPLMPVNQIKNELGERNIAYLHHDPLPSKDLTQGGLDRIYNHWFNINESWIHIPKIQKHLPYNLKPYWGSNWFCLPKRFVDYILSYIRNHPKLIPYFLYSRCSDEIFFQTILMNSPLKTQIINDNKRYIDWGPKRGPRPSILTSEDFPKIMKSNMWFARKFDMKIDSTILEMIDAELLRLQRSDPEKEI